MIKSRKKTSGFTLVELLAVVVILGILMTISIPAVSRWIDKSKTENIESQKKTLVMATKSYVQVNTGSLPKAIGGISDIPVRVLKQTNYLKDDIVNGDKKSCMAQSFVRIYKYDNTGYTYTAYIYCDGDTPPDIIEPELPYVKIEYSGDVNADDNRENLTTAAVSITIRDRMDTSGEVIGIESYRYTISANHVEGEKEKTVELYNSGFQKAGGRESLELKKSLLEFENVATVTNFIVEVEVYNRAGGYKAYSLNSSYKDSTGPSCGEIIGQAGENEWDKTWRTKKISVACVDNTGSGCVKDIYTKTFTKQMDIGYITIKDNAGNSTECPVRVHLDWTTPKVTMKAYKITNSFGAIGTTDIASVTVNPSSEGENTSGKINSYTDGQGSDSWLNKDKYPYGIYFKVETSDNVILKSGTYNENAVGLTKSQANDTNTNPINNRILTNAGGDANFTIKAEGFRRGKYVVKDAAGNTATINITAPIDRTDPVCGALTGQPGENEWSNAASRTISVACSDTISLCTKNNYSKDFTAEANTGTIQISDEAANSVNCGTRVHLDRSSPTVVVTAYARASAGGKSGNSVGSVTGNKSNTSVSISNYTGAHNSGSVHWLNNSNYPNGIYYEVSVSDNFALKNGVFSVNNSGYEAGASGVTTFTSSSTDQFSGTSGMASFELVEEGDRRAKYVVKDRAGNATTVNITAAMDRTKPIASSSKSNINKTDGVTISISCSNDISGCETVKYTKVTSTTSYTITDRAGNQSDSISVTVTSQRQKRDCSRRSACDCTKSEPDCKNWGKSCKECATNSGVGSTSQCWTVSSCDHPGVACDCSYSCSDWGTKCVEYSPADHCSCESWGSWYNVNSCSGECRTIYY